jgi:carbonic anhydrase
MGLAFDPQHPSALAVYCSDGRFTRAVEALLRKLGHDRLDTMTLPGGPALLNHGPADLSEVFIFSRATRFLIEAHKIKHAVLLAHQNCGFYRARFGRLGDDRILTIQIEHLQAAARALTRQHPELTVACYYARVASEQVVFDEIAQVDAHPARHRVSERQSG